MVHIITHRVVLNGTEVVAEILQNLMEHLLRQVRLAQVLHRSWLSLRSVSWQIVADTLAEVEFFAVYDDTCAPDTVDLDARGLS